MKKRYVYVLGFMFSPDAKTVLLIRKTHPEWQAGKLNGIGGGVKRGEKPPLAMVREFREETGWLTEPAQWSYFALLAGKSGGVTFSVHCFVSSGHLFMARTTEEELVTPKSVSLIRINDPRLVDNTPFLVALALDHMDDGRPDFTTVRYRAKQ